jgi:hypothetical protein
MMRHNSPPQKPWQVYSHKKLHFIFKSIDRKPVRGGRVERKYDDL